MIYWQLFLSFLQVGAFSVGGGYAAMPLIEAQVVKQYGWLTLREFSDLVTLAEMTPGPIAVNAATFVGVRLAGLAGALTATFGVILPSVVIVSLLSVFYLRSRGGKTMQTVLSCLRPAVVALIASAGLSILVGVLWGGEPATLSSVRWLGLGLFAAALLALRWKRWNPVAVLFGCGVANLLIQLVLGV